MKIDSKIKILEIGPGFGLNINLLKEYGSVEILEIDEYFAHEIEKNNPKIVRYSNITEIKKKYDLIVLMDVLEHIEDIKEFLSRLNNILLNQGNLIISVPAYQSLFSEHDVAMKHYRRYSNNLLKEHLKENFKIISTHRFNWILLPLRLIQIRLFRNVNSRVEINPVINFIFKQIIRLELLFVKINIKIPFGLSIFCLARKKEV